MTAQVINLADYRHAIPAEIVGEKTIRVDVVKPAMFARMPLDTTGEQRVADLLMQAEVEHRQLGTPMTPEEQFLATIMPKDL